MRHKLKITLTAAKTHARERMGELAFNKLGWCYQPAPGAWIAHPVCALLSGNRCKAKGKGLGESLHEGETAGKRIS